MICLAFRASAVEISTQLSVLMCQVGNVLRQTAALDNVADLERALVLDEFANGVEQ